MAKYVEILFRHRLRFLLLLLVLPSTLALVSVYLFPHQTSESTLWVDTPAYIDISPNVQGWNQYLTPAQNTVDALDQLKATGVFTSALKQKLTDGGAFQDASERDSLLASVSTDIVATATGSHVVTLSYTCPRQPLCTTVLTDTVLIYRQWLVDEQTGQAKVAIDFYTGQLSDAQAKLSKDQAALADFVATHPNIKASDGTPVTQFDLLTKNVDNDLLQVADLQQKLDNIRLTNAAVGQTDDTILKVVDPPRSVGGRLKSLPIKQMLIAAAAGFALGVGVLLFMAWSDRTVREARELEAMFRLPVVSTIPDLALMRSADV